MGCTCKAWQSRGCSYCQRLTEHEEDLRQSSLRAKRRQEEEDEADAVIDALVDAISKASKFRIAMLRETLAEIAG